MTFFRTAWQQYRLSHLHAHHINLANFHGLNLVFFFKWKVSGFEKIIFFEFTNFQFKNSNYIFFFVSSPMKSVTNYGVAWIGLNYYDYQDFHPKLGMRKHLLHMRRRACGHVDVSTSSFGSHLNPFPTMGADYAHLFWCPNKFWKPQACQ